MARSMTASANQAQLNLQLPQWPDHLRGVPWVALRTALFAPVRRGARRTYSREKLEAISDWQIVYTGFQLDQADLDVYECVLHVARSVPLGGVVEFRPRELLRQLGRSVGKSDREWLLRSLDRLQACAIEFKLGPVSYTGSLIQDQGRVETDDGSWRHFLRLNPKIGSLYDHGFNMVSWETRMQLGSNQLAKWLHGFTASLSRPLTFPVAKVASLSNSHYARERDFRFALEKAVAELDALGVHLRLDWDLRKSHVTFSKRKAAETS